MSGVLVEACDRLRRDTTLTRLNDGGGYRVAGRGADLLVVLPGVVGPGDALAVLAEALDGVARVVFVTYPRADSCAALLSWPDDVCRREGADRPVLAYGGSFGALVAQAWLAARPDALGDIVLSGAGPPDHARARRNARALAWMSRLPMPAWRLLLKTVVRLSTRRAEDVVAWRRFYDEAIAQLSWQDLESRYRVSIGVDEAGPPSPEALARWRGRLLVLEGEHDRVARGRVREALRATYPQAAFHVFHGAGHGATLERPAEWLRVVSAFLRK